MSPVINNTANWVHHILGSRSSQVVLTALISVCITAGTILGYQSTLRFLKEKTLKSHTHEHSSHDPIADKIAEYNAYDSLSTSCIQLETESHHNAAAPPNNQAVESFKDINSQIDRRPAVLEGEEGEDDENRRSTLLAMRACRGDYDEDLILEQLARNRVFLTDLGLKKLRSSFVIVVGCGGVGSHATAALARSGVGRLRLIDFDQVTLSSLNRHAVATLADVGTPKVDCMRNRLRQITPWIEFDCRNELFKHESADHQLAPWDGRSPDYVLDAIDNIDSKVKLLKYCHERKIPVISSMGAGCKSDPTRVFLGDISQSMEDPLSRSTRRRLRALGVAGGIPVCFSAEKISPGKAQLLPLPEDEFQKGKVGELGVLPDFRVRILPVLGTMPAVFGLCIANHIMLEITGYPHEYTQFKGREKMYDSILSGMQGLEERLAKWSGKNIIGLRLPISHEDVGYLIEEVYRGKSVVSGLATRLTLIRWGWRKDQSELIDEQYAGQKHSTLQLNDLVCMTKEESLRHEREVLMGTTSPAAMYGIAVIQRVADRMAEEAHFQKFR